MKSIPKMIDGIDRMNEAIGRVLCFSLIVIMLIQVMDVVLRYVFNNPTIWAMDMNTMLFTGASMLAGSYALLYDTHVRLDILYRNWGKKKQSLYRPVYGSACADSHRVCHMGRVLTVSGGRGKQTRMRTHTGAHPCGQ